EVQGLMGRYYAEAQGEDEAVAHAIEDHYKPKGPDDLVPADPVSIAVALADKIDTLVGFWAIDEKPTGSKDPYALRRAALGVVRLLLEAKIRLSLSAVAFRHFEQNLLQETDQIERLYDVFGTRDFSSEGVYVSDLEELFRIRFATSILANHGVAQPAFANYTEVKSAGAKQLPHNNIYDALFQKFFMIRDFLEFADSSRRQTIETTFGPGDREDYRRLWREAREYVHGNIKAV